MRKFILNAIAALGFLAIGMTAMGSPSMADVGSSRAPTCIDVGTC